MNSSAAGNVEYQKPHVTNAPQALRDVAEKSTAQAKETYEKVSAATGAATDLMKDAYSTTLKGGQDYSTKVLEFAHVNATAAFENAKQLFRVKSPTEFFTLFNDQFRQQSEILSGQAQELGAIIQKMTLATTQSVKAGIHKAV
jgi:hypothetical protein